MNLLKQLRDVDACRVGRRKTVQRSVAWGISHQERCTLWRVLGTFNVECAGLEFVISYSSEHQDSAFSTPD